MSRGFTVSHRFDTRQERRSFILHCPPVHCDRKTATAEEAVNGSGFTMLHQAAFDNADYKFVEHLIELGAWRRSRPRRIFVWWWSSGFKPIDRLMPGTMKSLEREGFVTAQDVADEKG